MIKTINTQIYYCDCCEIQLKHDTYINNTTGKGDGTINKLVGFDLCPRCYDSIIRWYPFDKELIGKRIENLKETSKPNTISTRGLFGDYWSR